MKKTGIFYGSSTGVTAEVARKLGKKLGIADADIHDVQQTSPDKVGDYDRLIFGSSTWGNGELQDDWYDFVAGVSALDLEGKTIALFGCGDENMSETFCDAVGELYDRLKETGATFIGQYNADGYSFEHSKASDGTLMKGLVLDEVNHTDLTDKRIADWCAIIGQA